MINNNSVLCVIPARGGSKGLPRKNIMDLNGKPLIAWTIEAAKECSYIDTLIVSTDDDEIADVARKYGADIPFMRPDHLASSTATAADVVHHVLDWAVEKNVSSDILLYLQPTAPARIAEDICGALELLFIKKGNGIISVCEVEESPVWSNTLPPDGSLKDFIHASVVNKNRQELPTYYRINGAIYLARQQYFRMQNSFHGKDTFAYIMPQERSIDIDTLLDFRLAQLLLDSRK